MTNFFISLSFSFMQLDYLGHSEFIINIGNAEHETVRILSDSWLSDYAYGDLMERNPKIRLDYQKLGHIDAIFLSHAHCDHFDPYTLMEMYRKMQEKPLILLPETLSFLLPILHEYLPEQKVRVLRNKEAFTLRGITIRGLIFDNDYITNEDEVMTLFVSNETEILYAEVDTIPPENAETQNYLYKILTEKKYSSVLYMATRNELEGNLKLLDLKTVADRKKFEKEYVGSRKDDFAWQYLKFSEDPDVDYPDISLISGFCKAIIGQGLIYPIALDPNSLALQTLSLDEIAKIDSGYAKESGNDLQIMAFVPGHSYTLENGKIQKGLTMPYLEYGLEKAPKDLDVPFTRSASVWPLSTEERNTGAQESLILNLLNTRFLPYWLANLESPFKSAMLASQGHVYVVAIRYGNRENMNETHYSYSFAKMAFSRMESLSKNINEDYWANDVEDFYMGTQELYSNFWHTLDLRKSYRLWTVLGACFLNNDIVYRKIAHHLDRASKWYDVDSFVLPVYEKLVKNG